MNENNGNTYWQDAIAKEMENMKVAFHILPNGENSPNGYQYVNCHMVLNIKMEDFKRKLCLAARDHVT